MLGSIISAVIGGAGGFGGSELMGMLGMGAGENSGLIGIISGILGGGAVGGLLGRGGDAVAAGQAAASGGINIRQILGGLLGGAGAGSIVTAIISMIS